MSYHLITIEPVPVWYIEVGHTPDFTDEPMMNLQRDLQPVNEQQWIAFRGVPISRLLAVVNNGVDVDPTNTTIFCADEDKAYEYARPESVEGGAGLMYALHGGYLERSFRVLPTDTPAEEIEKVRATYPHQYEAPHGLYFSRLPNQRNTAYESAYGYWVPGNARDALLAIFLTGTMEKVMTALSGSEPPHSPSPSRLNVDGARTR